MFSYVSCGGAGSPAPPWRVRKREGKLKLGFSFMWAALKLPVRRPVTTLHFDITTCASISACAARKLGSNSAPGATVQRFINVCSMFLRVLTCFLSSPPSRSKPNSCTSGNRSGSHLVSAPAQQKEATMVKQVANQGHTTECAWIFDPCKINMHCL
eukprot:g24651.t1